MPTGSYVRRALQARIAAGGDRVGGLLHGRDVRPHDAVAADVQRLLGMQLRHLDAVRRDADHRRDRRATEPDLAICAAVEHVLQAVAQPARCPTDCAPSRRRSRRTWRCSLRSPSRRPGAKQVSACWPASRARIMLFRRGISAILRKSPKCGGSEVRIILAASPECGLLNQATLDQYLLVSFDSEVRRWGAAR